MRELVRKRSQSVVVPHDTDAPEQTDINAISLKRFFHGWLREVPPRETNPREDQDAEDFGIARISTGVSGAITRRAARTLQGPDPLRYKRTILTIQDMLGVNRATVRESDVHRPWPREAVLKFLAADVVTRRNKQN